MISFKKISKKRISALLIIHVILGAGMFFAYTQFFFNEKAVIHTAKIHDTGHALSVHSSTGRDITSKDKAMAASGETITLTSREVSAPIKANAFVIEWKQSNKKGIKLEVRTRHSSNNSSWTSWAEADTLDGGKGNEDATAGSTIVLASTIDEIQYRFVLEGDEESSGSLQAPSIILTAIDSSKGPSGKKSFLQSLISRVSPSASADTFNPDIISRAQWGSPEPDWSAWQPEYRRLERAIIHHTATTETPNSYAAVRAIWQYHAVNLGWGDIGYNYLVDSAGNIFQGRYFDQNYARKNRVDVVAGHAYNNNYATTGIAAIGDFTKSPFYDTTLRSMAKIIGYKLAPYGIDPRADGAFGEAVIGHLQVSQTACPSQAIMNRKNDIKNTAFEHYKIYRLAYEYEYEFAGQSLTKNGSLVTDTTSNLAPSDDVVATLRLKNSGAAAWTSTGNNPIRLATSNTEDRTSAFYDSSWLSGARPGSFVSKYDPATKTETPTTVIQPGEVATFTFKLRVPTIVTTSDATQQFKEYFQLIKEGSFRFARNLGVHYLLNVTTHLYDWSYNSQALYNDPTRKTLAQQPLEPGRPYYASLSVKNTGNISWKQGSLRLGSSTPLNRTSALCHSSWINCQRPATIVEPEVKPGENATFEFVFMAPEITPSLDLKEYFRPLVEDVIWLKDIGQHWPIQVSEGRYAWQHVSQNIYTDSTKTTPVDPASLTATSRYYFELKLKNTGTLAWKKADFRLGTSNNLNRPSAMCDTTWLSCSRPATITQDVVTPGSDTTVGFWATLPSKSGTLKEYFRPVIENKVWLNDPGQHWPMTLRAATPSWQYVSQSVHADSAPGSPAISPLSLQPTTRYHLRLTLKNSGNTSWGPDKFRLGTSSPLNRTSVLCDTTWLSCSRPATITQDVVTPGSDTTVGFWITTPASTTQIKEYFRPLIEDYVWLNDPGQHWVLY